MDKYNFQYCQKIVVFSEDNSKVLLAKRKGENDYDGIFSFVGGKMETIDSDLVEGMRREKNEEIGQDCKISIYPVFNTPTIYRKKDGHSMVLPHYYAKFISGEIKINNEYSEYKWVDISQLDAFEPKIANVSKIVQELLKLLPLIKPEDLVEV